MHERTNMMMASENFAWHKEVPSGTLITIHHIPEI